MEPWTVIILLFNSARSALSQRNCRASVQYVAHQALCMTGEICVYCMCKSWHTILTVIHTVSVCTVLARAQGKVMIYVRDYCLFV